MKGKMKRAPKGMKVVLKKNTGKIKLKVMINKNVRKIPTSNSVNCFLKLEYLLLNVFLKIKNIP
jgi:hypothetical protein